MNEDKRRSELEWYNNAYIVTNLILTLIVLIIILSQSFAINNNMSTVNILRSILNHNSIYLLMLVYFIALKTSVGKKYFNFLNLFLILLYFITAITSLLTVFQSFTLNTLLSLGIHFFLLVYLVHTFFRGTRVWKEFGLAKSPFNEISNNGYFYTIIVFAVLLLTVNLISTTSLDGTILTLLDCGYTVLFSRYVYLYRHFLDSKKKDINNDGNFDKYREKFDDVKSKVVDAANDVKEKIDDFVEEKKLDEKIDSAKTKVVDAANDVKEKIDDFVEEKKLDEKIDSAKTKVVDAANDVKEKIDDFVEEKKLDEKTDSAKTKVVDVANDVKKRTSVHVKRANGRIINNKDSEHRQKYRNSSNVNSRNKKKGDK